MRTRKVSKRDELDTLQFTQLEDETDVKENGIVVESQTLDDHQHSRTWRPDDYEMGLTTTTIHSEEGGYGATSGGDIRMDNANRDGITMTREFEWDETRHS
jgi:hypothetical protein